MSASSWLATGGGTDGWSGSCARSASGRAPSSERAMRRAGTASANILGQDASRPPSFGRVRSIKEWKIKAGDLGHRLAGDRLQVSDHSDGRLDDGEYLRFALRPLSVHELAFLIEVVPHVVELLNDGIDALLELRTRQIVVDLLHLG